MRQRILSNFMLSMAIVNHPTVTQEAKTRYLKAAIKLLITYKNMLKAGVE